MPRTSRRYSSVGTWRGVGNEVLNRTLPITRRLFFAAAVCLTFSLFVIGNDHRLGPCHSRSFLPSLGRTSPRPIADKTTAENRSRSAWRGRRHCRSGGVAGLGRCSVGDRPVHRSQRRDWDGVIGKRRDVQANSMEIALAPKEAPANQRVPLPRGEHSSRASSRAPPARSANCSPRHCGVRGCSSLQSSFAWIAGASRRLRRPRRSSRACGRSIPPTLKNLEPGMAIGLQLVSDLQVGLQR